RAVHFYARNRPETAADPPRAVYLCAALVSASVSALVTTPLDVVKTRLQVQSVAQDGYRGISDAIRHMSRTEGARAFFRGAYARTLWLGPNAALAMLFCTLPSPFSLLFTPHSPLRF